MEIDIDSYAALAQGEDDIHVDLDENDFSDPHLLVKNLCILLIKGPFLTVFLFII
jgi:hypothetical protein